MKQENMKYVLETKGLTKKYGKFLALQEVNMNIPKGSIYGFAGKNGAGKTTLIRIICELQEPSAGGYSLYGISNKKKGIYAARRRVGAVVETPAVYMNMTARNCLNLQHITDLSIRGKSSGRRPHGRSKICPENAFRSMSVIRKRWAWFWTECTLHTNRYLTARR